MALHQLLPVEIATKDRVGTVKGGKNVAIDADGTMSVDMSEMTDELAKIKRLLGMDGNGSSADRGSEAAWPVIKWLLGALGQKSDGSDRGGSTVWSVVNWLLGTVGQSGDSADKDGSLWARVKYLLDCCEKVNSSIPDMSKYVTKSTFDTTVSEINGKFSNYVLKSTYDAKVAELDAAIKAIAEKIYGGSYSNGKVSFTSSGKAAVGNMNVYGGDSNAIKTRDGSVSSGSDNDVRVI